MLSGINTSVLAARFMAIKYLYRTTFCYERSRYVLLRLYQP